MRLEVQESTGTIVLYDFPYNKFLRVVRKRRWEPILQLLKVLESRKFLIFKKFTLVFPSFFALEFFEIFRQLGGRWLDYALLLKQRTWISRLFSHQISRQLDMHVIHSRKIALNSYQERFINTYLSYVERFDLRGRVMSFEQGLGKTRTAIALFLALHKKRVLIICPKSLLFSWKSELEKLGETDVSILSETSVIAKWNIINYDRLSSLSTSLTQTIDGIIVDETQYIIHLSAQRTKRVIELCKTSPNVKDILLLSGTPIKKDSDEWIPYLLILDPHITVKLASLFARIFLSHPSLMKHIAVVRMRGLVARETKEQLSLPPKKVVNIEWSVPDLTEYLWPTILREIRELIPAYIEEYRQVYLSNWLEVMDILSTKGVPRQELDTFVELCTRETLSSEEQSWLSQKAKYWSTLVDHPDLKHTLQNMRKLIRSFARIIEAKVRSTILYSKREQCLMSLIRSNWKKICLFTNLTENKSIVCGTILSPLRYLHTVLPKECGVQSVYVDSTIPNRSGVLQRFQHDDNIQVLVGSIGVLGVGLTLVEADRVLILNLPWRWADAEQMMDRVHRIGQKHPVTIYVVRLRSSELNIHDHMSQIALRSKKEVDRMLQELVTTTTVTQ